MPNNTIRIDVSQANRTIREMQRQLSAAQLARATARAINHTTAKAKSAAAQSIIAGYNIKSGGIKKRLPIDKAYPRILNGKVNASTKPTPLISIKGVRQTKQGVSVAVVKGRRQVIKSAFIQTTKKGRKGVFARGQYQGNQFEFRHKRIVKSGPDMPIAELNTVSVFNTGSSEPTQSIIKSVANNSYVPRLIHEMKQIINGVTR